MQYLCTLGRTLCPRNPIENWTPGEEQGTVRVSARKSLLGDLKIQLAKMSNGCSFFHSVSFGFMDSSDYRILIRRKYIIFCFSKCNKYKKLNLEKSISQDILSPIWLSQIINIFLNRTIERSILRQILSRMIVRMISPYSYYYFSFPHQVTLEILSTHTYSLILLIPLLQVVHF